MLKILSSIYQFSSVLLFSTVFVLDAHWTQPSHAKSGRKFQCELVAGIPTTVVKTGRGSIPTINWVKSFTGRYNNVNQRCNEVSTRLDRFDRNGKLKFIRTGNVNSYPVLCVDTGVSGNTCPMTSVLVTLPKGSDASHILQQILDLRSRAAGKVIQLSGEQLVRYRNGDAYVSIDRLLGE